MASNLVVVAYRDGRRLKGSTFDFLPTRDKFHLESVDKEVRLIDFAELKAVFFVRDLEGDPARAKRNEFPEGARLPGRKVNVYFQDGELVAGTTQGYDPRRPGFFLLPADAESNNQRVFVVAAAVKEITWG